MGMLRVLFTCKDGFRCVEAFLYWRISLYTSEVPVVGASKTGKPRPREIDFLLVRGFSDAAGKLRICPVEVKSSKRYSTVSLDDFRARWPKRVGDEIVLHPKQLRVEGETLLFALVYVVLRVTAATLLPLG